MEMIERVARAIRSEVFEDSEVADHMHEAAAARAARAAIAAMREPTEVMVEEADGWRPMYDDPQTSPSTYWQAMIDAALATPTARILRRPRT